MNHFMLPLWDGEGLATVKYGNIAIEKLLERMVALGASEKTLVAKVFGGADQLGELGYFSIGKRNVLVANDTLTTLGIPVVASNAGGKVGRKILFNTQTGQVLMKFVNS
ncbi:MAG TPA: chemotaxis protein CheD [Chryseosolibacter sp.]